MSHRTSESSRVVPTAVATAFATAAAVAALAASALAAPSRGGMLPLDAFLGQVRSGNGAVRAALGNAEGARERSNEGTLLTAPQVFGNAQLASDARLPAVPIFSYDKIVNNSATLGVQEQFSFGLQAKISYSLLYTSYDNPVQQTVSGPVAIPIYAFHEARPAVELVQPLWGGGFGRSVRAQSEASEAAALAKSYGSRYQARGQLVQAELAYWRLTTTRSLVGLRREVLDRAEKIHEWNARRVRMQLADPTDALQAEAALQLRRLELQQALDEERSAARAFNTARGVESDQVPETLVALDARALSGSHAPNRATVRDDVRAAQEQERAAQAQTVIGSERDTGTLDAFASYTFNGRDPELAGSMSDAFSANRPTKAIGIRFTYPLGGAASEARRGYAKEHAASEAAVDRSLFEQEQGWKDLNSRLAESRRRLELASAIERTQIAKLDHEKKRLRSGRSTTFQVLQFEQDYATAQLGRLQAQLEVRSLLTQMKLYSDSPANP